MVTLKPKKSSRVRVAKTNPKALHRVVTVRLDEGVRKGLHRLQVRSSAKLSLNELANAALATFIEKQAALDNELDQALRNFRAYRKADPGYKRAIKAFIDAEVAFAAGRSMEGAREPQVAGPAVSMVREMLRG